METYVLNASPREVTDRKAKSLRADGQVPAVLYGHGVAATPLAIVRGELEKVYRKAGGSSVVKVHIGSDQRNALIHDVQAHPVTGQFLHVDLFQVRMDEKIKAEVPLVFEGTPPAVRELDGVLVTNLNEIEVEALPADLPHEIVVDVESLETFDDTITVADLKIPAGVEVTLEPETNVALVSPPRTQEELEELEEEPEADTSALEEGADAEGGEEAVEGSEEGGDSGDSE